MAAEVAKPGRWWSAIPVTAPESKVTAHPNATLDAQAARLTKARHIVLQLDLAIQKMNSEYDSTLTDIERHYTEQLDDVKRQYHEKHADLGGKYRTAHESLMREQRALAEALKQVDCRAEFINHFPVPTEGEAS